MKPPPIKKKDLDKLVVIIPFGVFEKDPWYKQCASFIGMFFAGISLKMFYVFHYLCQRLNK